MKTARDDTPVITGLGLVTALGFGREANAAALAAGRTGIVATEDGAALAGTGLAALIEEPLLRTEVPERLETHLKFLNGAGLLAVSAAEEAWEQASWAADDVAPEAKGLWLAQVDSWDWSCIELRPGFSDATEAFSKPAELEAVNRSCARLVKPFFLLESIKNNAFSFVANLFDLQGANTAIGGFDVATTTLVDLAARALVRGDLDRALVVGAGRVAQGVARNDYVAQGLAEPSDDAGYRPLDADGVGLVPGEAAAALALERRSEAAAGHRPVLASLFGYGASVGEPLEGAHAPTPETIRSAVLQALTDAEVDAGDLAAIVLPAYGAPSVDRLLLEALEGIPALEGVPAVSWRGATGHTALADDLVSLAIAAIGMQAGKLPGTVGCREPLVFGSRRVATAEFDTGEQGVLLVGAGLWGQASALVLGR